MRKGASGIYVEDHDSRAVFVKDSGSTTYDLLFKRAVKEGRVGGAHRCPICGMRYHAVHEADVCCERVREKF